MPPRPVRTFLPPRPRVPRRGPDDRSAVLAAWRGVDLEPLERELKAAARPVGEVLTAALKRVQFEKKKIHAEVARIWPRLLDPNITAHAQPAGLHKGTLFVNVDSSVWLSEIVRYHRREILNRLQRTFGASTIARISFRQG